jgi:hypothetical protein
MLVQRYPTVAKGTSPSYGKSCNIVPNLNKNSKDKCLRIFEMQITYTKCVAPCPTNWKTLPHPQLEKVSTPAKISIRTTSPACITHLPIQPCKSCTRPAITCNAIPFLPDHWYPHPRYGIPARIRKKKSTHHMPQPCTSMHLNLEGISMWWWAMTKVLGQPR